MVTPASSPSSRAHIPAQLTTYSASMSPRGVRTPATAPPLRMKPVTGTPSMIRAPRIRAPRASDIVTSTGFTRPSAGM